MSTDFHSSLKPPFSKKESRRDFEIISSWVQPGSRILDLGCGDGSLLEHIVEAHPHENIYTQGIEKNLDTALIALSRGVQVIVGSIDHNLDLVMDDSFDMIILSKTIQELLYPDVIINKMLTKGKTAVVSFLNYGYWYNRFFFLFQGQRTANDALPFNWYDSPNLHPLSIKDFENYCRENHITILKKVYLRGDWMRENRLFPNILAGYAIYYLKKGIQSS